MRSSAVLSDSVAEVPQSPDLHPSCTLSGDFVDRVYAVHLDRVRAEVQASGRRTFDRFRRRRLRQRAVWELLRHARVRAAREEAVPESGRGEDGRVRLHRGLVQPEPKALGHLSPLNYERRHASAAW